MASQRYCGTSLADALKIICADRGYYDQHHTMHGAFQAIIPRETASSFLSTNTENRPRRLRRRTGQIVTECCINQCTRGVLETYCNPRVTIEPTRPAVTSLSPLNPRSQEPTGVKPQESPEEVPQENPRDSYPMGDNVVREDYEPPTNGGALTSGQPTPTENRISSGLREHSNTSIEQIPARTGNNSRVVTEGVNLTEGSEQSSLQDENSESETPTRSSDGERLRTRPSRPSRPRKPRPPRPPKRGRKGSKERKDRKKDKKKTKHKNDRGQRTNVKKQKSGERGSANPNPTRGGDREPTDTEQSRNRGKVNESQRPAERQQNNEEIDKLKKKITFIREALREVIIEPDSQIG